MSNASYLENPIYEYIKNNQEKNLDMVDITIYFKLTPDIIGSVLYDLEQKNKIKRENYFGCRYRYVILE